MEAPGPEVLFVLREGDDPAQLRTLAANVRSVTIQDHELQLPILPAHVTKLVLLRVNLVGPVVLSEGLRELDLDETTSLRPIGLWTLPASLREIYISACELKYLDLSHSQIKELHLIDQATDSSWIKLPASLKIMEIQECPFRSLPKLPAGLESLEITECLELEDFSGARDARILSLDYSCQYQPAGWVPPLALYENFSELRHLAINSVSGFFPEISLTHLKELSFFNCDSREPVEVNAPNLETLLFENSPDIQLRGNYSSGVTKITLSDHEVFPEGDGWDSLESIRVYVYDQEAELELPQLPWLRNLVTNKPVLTNGVLVSNILEYKQAWRMRRRVKRVQGQFY